MHKLKCAALGLAGLVAVGPALAGLAPGTSNMSLFAGQVRFDSDRNVKNVPSYGLGFGYQIDTVWSAELQVNRYKTESKSDQTKSTVDSVHLDFAHHYQPHDTWHPYWLGGIGMLSGNKLTQANNSATIQHRALALHVAGGVKLDLSDRTHLRAELREVISKSGVKQQYDMVGQVGVTWLFGKHKTKRIKTAQRLEQDAPAVLAEYAPKLPTELDIKFGFDSDVVEAGFSGQIDTIAKYLSEHPSARLRLTGHTDSTGPAAYNQKLSTRRAQAVANWIVAHYGIDSARIEAIGAGGSDSMLSVIEQDSASSRRVESELITGDQEYA